MRRYARRDERKGMVGARAAAGDAAAFGVLVRQHQSQAARLPAAHDKGNHALADDLAQETFLEAFRKIAQFGRGIVLRLALRHRLFALSDGSAQAQAGKPGRGGEHAGQRARAGNRKPRRLDLEKAMARLAPAQRAALTLCFALGLSHEEAAAALKIPLGTLKSHVNRGREKLAAMLDAGVKRLCHEYRRTAEPPAEFHCRRRFLRTRHGRSPRARRRRLFVTAASVAACVVLALLILPLRTIGTELGLVVPGVCVCVCVCV